MTEIFVSYRRKDSGGHARSLHKDLCSRFGVERIFFDRESIESGDVFTSRLDDGARQCKVLLALIGPDWLEARNDAGARRLDDPRDCVRGEVALALSLEKKVVPVLFDDTPMPPAERLPEDLRSLAACDALTLRGKTYDYATSFEELIRLLANVPGMPVPKPRGDEPGRRFFRAAEDLLSDYFSRDGELAALDAALPRARSAARVAPVAIHGMGGSGKTQLALAFAFDRHEEYAGIWWFRAERSDLLETDFALLCTDCGVPRDRQAEPFNDAMRWLADQPRWLLVFDNADLPEEVRPYIKPFRQHPGLGRHHLLITSRNPNWAGIATPLEVRAWTPERGTAFLATRLPREDRQVLRSIVERLGALPLALEQAAAYLFDTHMAAAGYLERLGFVDTARELLDKGLPVTDHQRTVATTLRPSVERLSPAAIDLLRLCAGMAADPIPLQLFVDHPDLLPSALSSAATQPLTWNDTVAELLRFSLASRVQFTSAGRSIDGLQFHRLTQEAAAASLSHSDDWRIRLAVLAASLPPDGEEHPGMWSLGLAVVPHLQVVVQAAASNTSGPADSRLAVEALNRATWLSGSAGLQREAADLAGMALTIAERDLDEQDPARCTSLSHMARTLATRGDLEEAAALEKQAVIIRSEIFGEDHPDTLKSMLTLADMLRALDNSFMARQLQEEVIRIRRDRLGEKHVDTLQAMNNLAHTLAAEGRLIEAAALHSQVLELKIAALGADHQSTLVSMNNLAETLRQQGNLAGARSLHQQVLDVNRRVAGAEHPLTLTSMTNLALTLQAEGQLAATRGLFEQVLEVNDRVRGAKHPETTESASNLYVTLRFHLDDRDAAAEVLGKYLAWIFDADPDYLSSFQRYVRRELGEWLEEDART